ncbi:MAG: type II secretion system protein GspL [Candidatus Dactylopiibacterium sp.]|nr:type II secretion system protein GspL [Candidatus Dactylopiibacterium sp.]
MNHRFALLRFRLRPEEPAGEVAWVAFDATGALSARGSARIAALPDAEQVDLVLPASRVTAHRLDVPVAGRHEAALIRQALEDRVLGALERSLVVSGARDANRLTVWVADRAWLDGELDTLAASGIVPARITPEQALLAPGQFAQTADGWAFCRATGEHGLLPSRELLAALGGEALEEQPDPLAAPPATHRVNLLAGLPRTRRVAGGFSFSVLRPVLLLVVAAALVHLFAEVLTWRQLVAQEANLRQTIRQNFAAARPGVPIVDPILQWRQGQGGARQGADALDALAGFAAQTGLTLRPRRIESDDGRLRLTLTVADAEQLKRVLQEKRIAFESSSTDTGLTQISLNLRAGGQS